ncbi:MAG: sugar phosphate isomerase/epimerase [Ruminococcaceae bacterium]|nr:sugar phosphate isomerase/epimerase [Oscillospiraceae bacterium]
MKKYPVALQLYSVRDFCEQDFEGTIKKVKDMGYDGVEFAGTYGRDAKALAEYCKSIGIVPISAHVAYAELMSNVPAVVKYYAEIGVKYIAIPYLAEDDRPCKKNYDELLKNIKVISAECKKYGIELAYHNHDFEFEVVDGVYALDKLYTDLTPDELKTELDLCWVNVGGENPSTYILKYSDRAPIVHFKDFAGKANGKMYALIGVDDDADTSEKTDSPFEFRPVGKGYQKFPEILESVKKCNTEWIVVEQDQTSMGLSSLECAEESIKYLNTINK